MLSENVKNFPYTCEITGSTRNVLLAVALGKADAGATLSPTFDKEPEDIRRELRPILETEEIPPHPLCGHPRVPDATRQAVGQAVLKMAATPDGAEILGQIRFPSPTTADYAKDYMPLEKVEIRDLSNWGK